MPHQVFLSYSRRDTAIMQRVYHDLSAKGLDVWIDETGIPPGTPNWLRAIQDAIDETDCIVVLFSPAAKKSNWVAQELIYAETQKKQIFPLLVRGDEGNAVIFGYAAAQWIDIRDDADYETGMQRLIGAIYRQLGEESEQHKAKTGPTPKEEWTEAEWHKEQPAPLEAKPEPPDNRFKRILLLIIVALIVAVLVIVGAFIVSKILSGGTPTATPTTPAVTQNPTATDTPGPTLTETPTLEIIYIVQTLDAQATIDQGTQFVQETAAARATGYAVGTQEFANQTATATLWTDTPTPDITASIDAYRTQQVRDMTATADSWTDTPTATDTPSYTPTFTPTATDTPTPIPPGYPGGEPITANDQWAVVSQDFDGMEMVLVPVGCFMMGSEDGDDNEMPVHKQCFDQPFWVDKYEVTNAQFSRLGGKTGRLSNWMGDTLPREMITWFEARNFCQLRGGRLPTEAEWEYAARGPDDLVYPWGNRVVAENVVYYLTSGNRTAEVGSKPGGVSWVGANDMSGNVWEWTSSLYKSYPYDASDGREDDGGGTVIYRVLRGGSWDGNSINLRAAYRYWSLSGNSLNGWGFRCARSYDSGS